MRLFQTLEEAGREIKRDLTKSPLISSPTIQNLNTPDLMVREAMNYSYTVMDIPDTAADVIDLAVELGLTPKDDRVPFLQWLHAEELMRTSWIPENGMSEILNPNLAKVLEGEEPSYTYTDRLMGAVDILSATLNQNPDSRRAYYPMFNREDSIRAPRHTRVPCTLGYWVAIRKTGGELKLHMTYLERSCDYRRFWIYDAYLARYLQRCIHDELNDDVQLGHLTHTILSFHFTVDEGEEIY